MVQGSKSQTALPEDLPSALQGGSQSSATAVTGNPPPFCPLRTPEMHRYTHTGKAPDAEHKIKIISKIFCLVILVRSKEKLFTKS